MARFRISEPAQRDLVSILATNLERWGLAGQKRYAAHLAQGFRFIAKAPMGPMTRERSAVSAGLRSLPLRYVASAKGVNAPVLVVFYRCREVGLVEIVRVLRERMDFEARLGDAAMPAPRGRRPPR